VHTAASVQHRCQHAQAPRPARDDQQPGAVAQQRRERPEHAGGAEVVDGDVVINHLGRVVTGLDPRVVVGEDDVDAAVPLGERCGETGNGIWIADIDHRTVNLGSGGRDGLQRFGDPRGIPAGQVHDVVGFQPLGQPLHERKPEVASGARHHCYCVH
jgi:hypothetical protein